MSPLANQDPLAQLNDIIGPSAPSWFPPALIYWILLLFAVSTVVIAYYLLKKLQRQRTIQQPLLVKLEQLQQQKADFITLNQLLKGCALSYLPRSEVASLHGEQWFDFLQKHSSVTIFESKQVFMKRLYQSNDGSQPTEESDFIAAKNWITALPKQIKKAQQDV